MKKYVLFLLLLCFCPIFFAGCGGNTEAFSSYDIKIVLDTIEDVLKVPVEAVIYNSGVYSVFVYDEDEETVTKRTVTKGSLDDSSYEIVDGLKEGEMVVKSPDPNMEDGTKIAKKNG